MVSDAGSGVGVELGVAPGMGVAIAAVGAGATIAGDGVAGAATGSSGAAETGAAEGAKLAETGTNAGALAGVWDARVAGFMVCTAAQPIARTAAVVSATFGANLANIDSLFAEVERTVRGRPGFAAGIAAAWVAAGFSRNDSRSRSAITSLMMSRSMVLRFKAHPKDIALKHRLLMLRGIPSLCSAIILRAPAVKIG